MFVCFVCCCVLFGVCVLLIDLLRGLLFVACLCVVCFFWGVCVINRFAACDLVFACVYVVRVVVVFWGMGMFY